MVMAKRKYSKRSKNMEPAVMSFAFSFTAQPGNNNKYVDLSQAASILNRRFYRQGVNWAVAGFKVLNVDGMSGSFQISKLPNTWVLANAWVKSFKAWQKMISIALEGAGAESIKGKFLDFKIFADSVHHNDGFALNLPPLDALGAPATPGEWIPSQFELPNVASNLSTPQDIVAVGPNFPGISPATGRNAVSMIQGYADSRSLPYSEDPNVPADADTNWMVRLFSDGSEQDQEVIAELELTGDTAPYPYENDGVNFDTMYPGGETQLNTLEFHDIEYFTPTTISNTVRLKGGNFPCGLMKLSCLNNETDTRVVTIVVDMIPGNHRGYLCESMMDM